ncbi:MAG TPA: Abi family protein [bacterium]|nr:Abi family protein [bacterium]HMW35234.1 Abi family protein [bacterium]HMZ03533.1 Abi family protein [bacterium]HNB08090.1 Abi family protein [bacterium]HND76501.1 Abi family protein [bacterium]
MDKAWFQKVFSEERTQKYFETYPANDKKAIEHYACNIMISEAFYPALSIFEVALRNSVNRELETMFHTQDWYQQIPTTAGLVKLNKDISNAKRQIMMRNEAITASKVVAELTLGFWVRLFNTEYERILWKNLRLAFPYLEKRKRQRHTVSAPLNRIRDFRNRVFHNEPVCWNINSLENNHKTIVETLFWLNKDLPDYLNTTERFHTVLNEVRKILS